MLFLCVFVCMGVYTFVCVCVMSLSVYAYDCVYMFVDMCKSYQMFKLSIVTIFDT